MRRMTLVLGMAAGLVLAACGSATHPGSADVTASAPTTVPPTNTPPTTVPPTTAPPSTAPPTTGVPATTSTTVAPNPSVVPAVITPAYVNAVFAVLNHVYGNATRLMIATTNIPPQAAADLRAIFADPEYETELKAFSITLAQGFGGAKTPLGDRLTTVVSILSSSSTCIYAQTKTNFAAVTVDPQPQTGPEYYALESKPSSIDPDNLNSSAWAIFFNASFQSPTPPPTDPCPA
jgi:hypothetical protein